MPSARDFVWYVAAVVTIDTHAERVVRVLRGPDAGAVCAAALCRLATWDDTRAHREWSRLLTLLGPVEIARFLEEESGTARRLISSSPFRGTEFEGLADAA